MRNDRLKLLFTAAACVETPAGENDLPERVLRVVRRETIATELSLFDQLGQLLPRVAVAAALVAAGCLLVEFSNRGDLAADVVQVSEQWLFATN